MRHSGLMVLALAAGCVAVDAAEDADFSEAEQAVWDGSSWAEGETVIVQGGLDSCQLMCPRPDPITTIGVLP